MATPSPAEVPQLVMRSVALLLARHEVRNLRRWFEEFDRDILLPILLGEIALHNIGAFENHREPAATTAAPAAQVPSVTDMPLWDGCSFRPCNAYSISAATGLPRETVRRKLERLSAMGKVERNPDGRWVYRGTGVSDAEVEFTRKTVLKFLGTAQTLLTVLDQVKVNPEPSENGATQAI